MKSNFHIKFKLIKRHFLIISIIFKCYDVRFPQLSTILRKLGAHILTYPSVFTVPTGKAHWEVLLRARAIENQCYVIAAAQYGKHNEKRSSYGHSMVEFFSLNMSIF